MAKVTVQTLILDKLDKMETKIDKMIPVVEGLKVKSGIMGTVAGAIGAGIISLVVAAFK